VVVLRADGRTSGRADGEVTRERLLRAALDLYTTTGFLGTTTPALAARAGVAEGTIYRHFTSKEQLLNEAHRRAYGWALETLAALEADRVRRGAERLAYFGRLIVDKAAQDAPLIRMLFSNAHEPFLDEPSRAVRRGFREGVIQLVAMGKSDGQVRSGPADVWAEIWLAIVAYAAERVAAGEWAAESAPAGLTLEAAWNAIAARAPGTA
jgi:AcrR family transcriptional regulator